MTDRKKSRGSSRPGPGRAKGSAAGMLYGLNPVLEALSAGAVQRIYLYSGRRSQVELLMKEAASASVEVKVMHDMDFFDSRFPKGHQGVAADINEARQYDIEEILDIARGRGEQPFVILLDGVEDPRNFGAILRSAEAAGMHGAVMEKRRSAGLGPEAIKASAGAALHLPVAVVSNIKHTMRALADEGVLVVGAEGSGQESPYDVDLSGPLALVVGSEGSGVRRTVLEACDHVVSLPMRGRVGSLNASVAAGVLIFEALRQRQGS